MRRLPAGIIAIAVFFVFGAIVSLVTFVALLYPSTRLSVIWRLNPQAHQGFLRLDGWATVLMLTVSVGCGLAARGLIVRAAWGYRLAVGILAVNLLGDTLNAILKAEWRLLIGLPIGGGMITYLLRSRIRHLFFPGTVV
jgi:hypothetical protein